MTPVKTYKQTITDNGKAYTYEKRFIFPKESLGDLIILLGAEGVLNLLKYFPGTYFYIPKSESVKRQIVEACIREQAEKLHSQGLSRQQIVNRLCTDFPAYWSRKSCEIKLVEWFSKKAAKHVLKRARQACLIDSVAKHREAFKRHGLI